MTTQFSYVPVERMESMRREICYESCLPCDCGYNEFNKNMEQIKEQAITITQEQLAKVIASFVRPGENWDDISTNGQLCFLNEAATVLEFLNKGGKE